MVDRTGLTDSQVLCALYNASQPLGLGFLTPGSNTGLSVDDCQMILEENSHSRYFDYLQGRVMKIDVSENPLNPRLYDRDNGPGAVERVISELRAVKIKITV